MRLVNQLTSHTASSRDDSCCRWLLPLRPPDEPIEPCRLASIALAGHQMQTEYQGFFAAPYSIRCRTTVSDCARDPPESASVQGSSLSSILSTVRWSFSPVASQALLMAMRRVTEQHFGSKVPFAHGVEISSRGMHVRQPMRARLSQWERYY